VVDRLLAVGDGGFDNVTEASSAVRSAAKLSALLTQLENDRPIGAVVTCAGRAGKLWIPKPGSTFVGQVHGHLACLSGTDHPQVVRFLTVNGPEGLIHVRVSPKEGEGRFPPSPELLQMMVRDAYLLTAEEFPLWMEVSIGAVSPTFVGVLEKGQQLGGPVVPPVREENAPVPSSRGLAAALAAAYSGA